MLEQKQSDQRVGDLKEINVIGQSFRPVAICLIDLGLSCSTYMGRNCESHSEGEHPVFPRFSRDRRLLLVNVPRRPHMHTSLQDHHVEYSMRGELVDAVVVPGIGKRACCF